jgi:hypothetical protein
MLGDSVTLVGDAASSHPYALTSLVDGNSVRRNASVAAPANEFMQVKHQQTTRSGIPLDRHTLRIDKDIVNAQGVVIRVSYYVVVEVPQDVAATQAIVKDMRTQVGAWMATDANLVKVLNGES